MSCQRTGEAGPLFDTIESSCTFGPATILRMTVSRCEIFCGRIGWATRDLGAESIGLRGEPGDCEACRAFKAPKIAPISSISTVSGSRSYSVPMAAVELPHDGAIAMSDASQANVPTAKGHHTAIHASPGSGREDCPDRGVGGVATCRPLVPLPCGKRIRSRRQSSAACRLPRP